VLSILLALYMPVLISKMIQKIKSPFMHQCFGL
ncbi:acyltransferase, partial [Bacteroides xylanisolvens]